MASLAASSSTHSARPPQGWDEGLSRRQITVMFCDLVGSTQMSERLDPEEVFQALAAYHGLVKRIAIRFGGHIDKIVGDGVDVFFGYPVANEDDAARAVHAAVAIAEQIVELRDLEDRPMGLQVRIGIATGRVAVGRMSQVSIAGTTPNLAARIQRELAPGVIGVSPSTRRVAGTQFEYRDLGRFRLKGFTDEIEIFAVVGSRAQHSRSAWRRQEPTLPIGRDAELRLLSDLWRECASSPARAALLQAEAGMGKTRLAQGLVQLLQDEPHLVIQLQSSPFHSSSVLYPFVQHLVQAAGFSRTDSALIQAEKLEAQLAIAGISASQDLALIAALLDVRVEQRYPPLEMPPQARLQMTEDLLVRYFSALANQGQGTSSEAALMHYFHGMARRHPLVIVIEDLHWIDPTSLDMVDRLVGNPQLPHCLILMTARPEFTARFARPEALTTIALSRLEEPSARRMVEALCEAVALPEDAVAKILLRTDGIPLYIEEMTRMVLDAQGARTGLVGDAIWDVPDTLADLLMERLDRLGPAKSLAQTASAIGSSFPRDLLAASAQADDEAFDRELAVLLESGLLQADGARRLRFKHALVEKAAYDSILLRSRVRLHARIAGLLQGDFEVLVRHSPEILAHQLARADQGLEASRYLLQAGVLSLQHGAPREAAVHLRAGLEALQGVAASIARSEAELQLLSVLGPTTMVLSGPGSAPFGDVQKRAFALCRELPGRPRQFPITYGLCLYHWGRAELETARTLSAELRDAAADHDDEAVMAAHNMSGMIALHLGDPVAARDDLRRSVERYQPQRDAALYPVYLMDFGVFGRFYLALSCFVCGEADEARRHALDAHALAQTLNQPHSLGFSLLANFNVAVLRGEPELALRFAEECVEFSSRLGFPEFIAMARVARGWANAMQGHPVEGLADLEAGIDLWKQTGFENWQSWFGCLRVGVLDRLDRVEDALEEIETQVARLALNGERLFLPLLLGHRSVLLRRRGDAQMAAQVMADARGLAARQGAVGWSEWLDQRAAGSSPV